jgi:BirA family biotin operon repressor/biotin-[acetyl-CoA-carboxylase] ligase
MYKDKILKHLISANSSFTSGAVLARMLHISRAAVWKHIKALEREGYEIEAVRSKGYRLAAVPDILLLDDIKEGLKTRIIGKEILLFPEAASTNTLAMELAAKGAADGTVVIAETQTGGKGRLGRSWISPKGNLYISVILRPEIPPHKAPLITLMAAVAVASTIRQRFDIQAGIKWPNDILISGKKMAGLLTEMRAEPDRVKHVVLGIGINVNMDIAELPVFLRKLSTTLSAETGKKIDRALFLQQFLAELDRWYQIFLKSGAAVIEAWEMFNATVGNRVAVSGPEEAFEGTAQGIDADGRLILKLDDGTVRQVAAGDVTILKNREMKNAE